VSDRKHINRSRRLAFLVCVALAFGPAAAMAQTQQSSRPLSAAQVFAVADHAVAAGKLDDAAAMYEALAKDPNPQVRAEARFRKGMMLADAKRFAEAAVEFRKVLDEQPGALRVRLELARVLAAMGREGDARRELRQAEAGHLPADVAINVNRFSQALQSTQRFGGSFELAIAPDSNINRATDARTLDTIIAPLVLSQDARAESGLGIETAASGFVRLPVTGTLSVLPRISVAGTVYGQSEFDDISSSALVGLEYMHGADRWTPSVGETWRWYGGKTYAETTAVTAAWLHPLTPTTQLTVTGGASSAAYLQNKLQDGQIYNAAVQIDHAYNPTSGISVTLAAARQTATDPGYATWSGTLSVLSWREFGRVTAFVSFDLGRTVADERIFLFPNRREDWLSAVRTGVTLRQLTVAGFAPTVRIGLERNQSKVGLYDYRRIYTNVGVSRAF
jgi:tetratricopeptide (TPR) repeat protein